MTSVIAIGALGGSGTRAFAQVLMNAGVYMGDNLNGPGDNRIFTHLFKDPAFYECATQKMIAERLAVFQGYMERDHLSWQEAKVLMHASASNALVRSRFKFDARAMLKILSWPKKRLVWGWKEPNTQIYLQELDDYFVNLKYIHVIRHGLDMAFSRNKKQLKNWGHRYDLSIGENDTQAEVAYKQLEYWVRSTRTVMEQSKMLRGDFLLVNHTEFCEQPQQQIDRILNFIQVDVESKKREALYRIPKIPRTAERFRKHDLGMFDQSQIDFVKDLGFDV